MNMNYRFYNTIFLCEILHFTTHEAIINACIDALYDINSGLCTLNVTSHNPACNSRVVNSYYTILAQFQNKRTLTHISAFS